MKLFELNAESRQDVGKGASRRLRREADKIPAIIYGGGKDPVPLTLVHSEVLQQVEHEAFYSHILNLVVDGKKNKVILKDIQRHPFKPKVSHMDFMRVSDKDVIQMSVPLHFINEDKCVGIKAGGNVQHHFNTLNISCKAKDLPEYIEIDLTELDVNDVVHISDISLPKGVSSVDLNQGESHDQAVVSVHKRGVSEEDEDGEGEASTESTED